MTPIDGEEAVQLELYISGVGGQGIQLMAKILALAALKEDRHVMLASDYGFTMRGGSSIATVILGARPLNALPVIAGADAALFMHHQYLEKPVNRLRAGALVIADSHLMDLLPALPKQKVISVPASEIAKEVGSPMTAGLALLSGFAAITGLVRTESLIEAMKSTVPSYRTQHIESNAKALRLAAERVTASFPIDLDAMASRSATA